MQMTPCGFCFVEYFTRRGAEDCVKYLNGTTLDEREVRIDFDWGFEDGRQFGRGKSGGQVRDEYRTDFDQGRGGYGKLVAQARKKLRFFLMSSFSKTHLSALWFLLGAHPTSLSVAIGGCASVGGGRRARKARRVEVDGIKKINIAHAGSSCRKINVWFIFFPNFTNLNFHYFCHVVLSSRMHVFSRTVPARRGAQWRTCAAPRTACAARRI